MRGNAYFKSNYSFRTMTDDFTDPKGWHPLLDKVLDSQQFIEIKKYIKTQKDSKITIYPEAKNYFKALQLTPFCKVKVIILGQDPYHNGQAIGLSFAVEKSQKLPPSLKNIYKELESDLNITRKNGDLSDWAKNGVLLLNSTLTVEANKPSSHQGIGWNIFTDEIIKILSTEKERLVFMLWGNHAKRKKYFINNKEKHCILEAYHPSPRSACRGFFCCKHFSKANKYLETHYIKEINWKNLDN